MISSAPAPPTTDWGTSHQAQAGKPGQAPRPRRRLCRRWKPAVAVIALVTCAAGGGAYYVGGIDVMSSMLVSVTKRAREIGLQKARGATRGVVRREFLVEASRLGLGALRRQDGGGRGRYDLAPSK